MRLILFEPDIAENTGTLLRLAACWGIAVDVIEPCGFVWDDRRLRRAGLDYIAAAHVERHASWEAYQRTATGGRLILLTSRAVVSVYDLAFAADDRLMVGRESTGVPDAVHAAADMRVRVPMRTSANGSALRSLNVAIAAAVSLGEALRQTQGLPPNAT